MYAAFRECEARRNACCDKAMPCCDKVCAVPQQDHVSKQCESPECECMQHFESAKHGEMRVATRLVAQCDKECAVLRQDRAALRHYLGL